jgi:hypothetical protein
LATPASLAISLGLVSVAAMSEMTCPMCEMNEILELPEIYQCVTCGHEWEREEAA